MLHPRLFSTALLLNNLPPSLLRSLPRTRLEPSTLTYAVCCTTGCSAKHQYCSTPLQHIHTNTSLTNFMLGYHMSHCRRLEIQGTTNFSSSRPFMCYISYPHKIDGSRYKVSDYWSFAVWPPRRSPHSSATIFSASLSHNIAYQPIFLGL